MLRFLALLSLASSATAAEPTLKLFDGESTFGWTVEGKAEVKDGVLTLGGDGKPASISLPAILPATGRVQLATTGAAGVTVIDHSGREVMAVAVSQEGTGVLEFHMTKRDGTAVLTANRVSDVKPDALIAVCLVTPQRLGFKLSTAATATLRAAVFFPASGTPLFNGKNLDGWKVFKGDAKKEASKWSVTPAGELKVENGPGDLQTTAEYADFLVRLDVKTMGKALNSGLFFRCLPDKYQQGYEAQIQNAFLNDDRTKPADFGTGAIYRRVPARKVVSNDNDWFTLHVLAVGPQIRTWVNGEPVVAWVDDRPANDNGRNGRRVAAGRLSLQGHDPTTHILFKNLTVADLAK